MQAELLRGPGAVLRPRSVILLHVRKQALQAAVITSQQRGDRGARKKASRLLDGAVVRGWGFLPSGLFPAGVLGPGLDTTLGGPHPPLPRMLGTRKDPKSLRLCRERPGWLGGGRPRSVTHDSLRPQPRPSPPRQPPASALPAARPGPPRRRFPGAKLSSVLATNSLSRRHRKVIQELVLTE